MTKIAGSGSGSISQNHGSADPDPVPDPHQNEDVFCYLFKKHLNPDPASQVNTEPSGSATLRRTADRCHTGELFTEMRRE
jgi:hypothetical protein